MSENTQKRIVTVGHIWTLYKDGKRFRIVPEWFR